MKKKKAGLTDKQNLFGTLVGSAGYTLADAYREAYDCEKMKPATIRREASKLLAHPLITTRVKELSAKREAVAQAQALAKGVSDREAVLTRLRHMMDHADPNDSNKIRATVELGRSCGVFTDTIEVKAERGSQDIAAALREKLEALSLSATDGEQSVH